MGEKRGFCSLREGGGIRTKQMEKKTRGRHQEMRVRLRPCLLTSAMFPKSGDPSARCQTSSPGCRAAPVPNATCQPPFSVRAMRDPTLGCSSLCRAASPGENLGSGLPAPQGTASPATARWVARCQSPSDLGRWWHRGWCRVGFSIVTETPWPGLAGRLGVNLRGCPQCPPVRSQFAKPRGWRREGTGAAFLAGGHPLLCPRPARSGGPRVPPLRGHETLRTCSELHPLGAPRCSFLSFGFFFLSFPTQGRHRHLLHPHSALLSRFQPLLPPFSASSFASMRKKNKNKNRYPGFSQHKAASEVNGATCKGLRDLAEPPAAGHRLTTRWGWHAPTSPCSFQAETRWVWGSGEENHHRGKRKRSMCCRREKQCHRQADTAI